MIPIYSSSETLRKMSKTCATLTTTALIALTKISRRSSRPSARTLLVMLTNSALLSPPLPTTAITTLSAMTSTATSRLMRSLTKHTKTRTHGSASASPALAAWVSSVAIDASRSMLTASGTWNPCLLRHEIFIWPS